MSSLQYLLHYMHFFLINVYLSYFYIILFVEGWCNYCVKLFALAVIIVIIVTVTVTVIIVLIVSRNFLWPFIFV